MPNSVARQAVVVGAGMGGLAAAAALSTTFERVTILERDALLTHAKARRGTPQANQLHVLLGGGFDVLCRLFSGFEKRLDEVGAVRVRTGLGVRTERPGFDPFPQRDLGWDTFCLTRPLLEFVVRRSVEQTSGIEIRSRCKVTNLVASTDGKSVVGARYNDANGNGQEISADLVIDASSRGVLTLTLLDEIGFPRPEMTEIGIDLAYATATFSMSAHASHDWKALLHRPNAPDCSRGAFIFPIEDGQWQVALNTYHGDIAPGDIDGFLAFAESLRMPTCYNAIKDVCLIDQIHRFTVPSSLRRHFERLEVFPDGLIPLGDAVCRLNPVFGQGMSVALLESDILARLLEARSRMPNPLNGLGLVFFKEIQSVLASAWSTSESDLIYPKTTGARPADFCKRLQYSGALSRIAAQDVDVQRKMGLVAHLLAQGSVLRNPELVSRVNTLLAA